MIEIIMIVMTASDSAFDGFVSEMKMIIMKCVCGRVPVVAENP